jgi:hypothetical protein
MSVSCNLGTYNKYKEFEITKRELRHFIQEDSKLDSDL